MSEYDIIVYYVRDNRKQPFATVAIMKDSDGKWCRGVSICSDKDSFIKRVGRQIAIDRCLKAYHSHTDDIIKEYNHINPVFNGSSINVIDYINETYINKYTSIENLNIEDYKNRKIEYKSAYNVVLTDYEKRIITKPSKEQ